MKEKYQIIDTKEFNLKSAELKAQYDEYLKTLKDPYKRKTFIEFCNEKLKK